MPWKFVCDLSFLEVLQTIIWLIMKGNEEIEKIEKYSQKPSELCTNLSACLCVCVCMWVVIVAYYFVLMYKWCLVYVCVKIYTQRDKFEVVYRIGKRSCS